MAQNKSPQVTFDLQRVQAELQSPNYRERVAQVKRDVKSLQEKAIIDRNRLNVPVSF
ncbi:hypothetical protein [Hymenobacter norwichensis]|uniref:hypothetical protein n=1 Tax=Hymenobacter norwichensis TaxID=223903 RepID=UPI0003F87AC4|nr:hypothetical protein [Hymenobacter norwichensis]